MSENVKLMVVQTKKVRYFLDGPTPNIQKKTPENVAIRMSF